MSMKSALATTLILGVAVPSAGAQANVPWVSFSKQPSMLAAPPLSLCDTSTQVSFRTADLNKDGWDDVVAMRKPVGAQNGKRPAILLMNDHGVLEDQTALYASASDVPGDSGFLTPCNNYESAIGDVNGDTWPDVVTCVALSDGDHKNLSHPRVYVNLGNDGSGHWLGLRFEAARFPQLFTVGGLAVAPRFTGVGLGDVTGDGLPDLYFIDLDGTDTGIAELPAWDLNDRLLVNDGNGYFTDQSFVSLTTEQLKSGTGCDVKVLDINEDGHNDIIKATTIINPRVVRIVYNNPAAIGDFTATGVSDVSTNGDFKGVDVGDLNHDGFKDVVIADGGKDAFSLGTGFDAANKMIWGPKKFFSFVSTTGDDGACFNTYIRDLDGDGWNDVLISSVDVEQNQAACVRRLHLYHNTGSVAGDMNLVMKEEAEFANTGTGAGWKGVVGMTALDEKGTYDVGFGDFDKDGDLDLLVGTCTGAQFFRNETKPWTDLGSALAGVAGTPALVGEGPLTAGSAGTLTLSDAAPSAAALLFISASSTPTPFKCGTLIPVPWAATLLLATNGSGAIPLAWAAWPAGLSGVSLYWQYAVQDVAAACGASLSNALRADVP